MDKTIRHPVYGVIRYDENIWTGKRTLAINGTTLRKVKKNVYTLGEGECAIPVTLKGNALTGASVFIRGEELVIYSKPSVLDWILSILPLALVMAWGNNPALRRIIPMTGGAVGGAIGALAMVLCMCQLRGKTLGKKLLIGLLTLVATLAGCVAMGFVFVIAFGLLI